ncbi:cytochrome B6 [Desulfuromonas sp. KJ2020]|uniref:selenite/tellurite reduction operon b-type cytochrome membrane protein ExtQ n=1 Tax=Desulfuromonas sp. KJ2020 TaxID=2919173 RepID=UPI0020A6F81D|nr:selenite/tellurite reduction operon b-type cytochrome membrane protein ExtQ [Desulfuromonas sp. KJ2020]MCP3176825.1 cytochrome B6 [Desulfuromonas sp. KJ2020]
MKKYVFSAEGFFPLIKRAAWVTCLVLMGLALLLPAPLQGPADIATVPNPVKSAWFLLWTQELVSYSKYLVYLIIAGALAFLLLPFLPGSPPASRARWFGRDQFLATTLCLVAFFGILTLTLIAMFFRGENWAFVLPF